MFTSRIHLYLRFPLYNMLSCSLNDISEMNLMPPLPIRLNKELANSIFQQPPPVQENSWVPTVCSCFEALYIEMVHCTSNLLRKHYTCTKFIYCLTFFFMQCFLNEDCDLSYFEHICSIKWCGIKKFSCGHVTSSWNLLLSMCGVSHKGDKLISSIKLNCVANTYEKPAN